jgi:hypothetical protein
MKKYYDKICAYCGAAFRKGKPNQYCCGYSCATKRRIALGQQRLMPKGWNKLPLTRDSAPLREGNRDPLLPAGDPLT